MVIVKAYLKPIYSMFKGLGLFKPTCWPRPNGLLRVFFFFFATGFVNRLQARPGHPNRPGQAENIAFNR